MFHALCKTAVDASDMCHRCPRITVSLILCKTKFKDPISQPQFEFSVRQNSMWDKTKHTKRSRISDLHLWYS